MLGVRLKTWVKTHLGRERNHSQRPGNTTSYLGGGVGAGAGAPFTKPSVLATSRSAFEYRSQNMNSVANVDKSTSSSISNSTSTGPGGLVVNGSTLLSSPDTGYSTDGLSNSNLLNHCGPTADTNSPSSNTASTPLSLHQYATAKKREWFLQNTSTSAISNSSSISPADLQFKDKGFKLPPQSTDQSTPRKPIKPIRIQTNPWYNPKPKRLSSTSAGTQDNQTTTDQHQHPRHSTCTTITADSGEGSYDSQSQKSSPHVSFSSSSLESYKHDKGSGNCARYAIETNASTNRKNKKSVRDCSREDELIVKNSFSNTKSPYKGWYQPPVPISVPVTVPAPVQQNQNAVQYDNDNSTLLSSKLSSFTPYFVHAAPAGTRKQDSLSPPNERSGSSSKIKAFGFLRKLFRKGSSKKGRRSNGVGSGRGASAAEVSLHDLYYHQTPVPAAPGGTSTTYTSASASVASPYFFTELQQPPPPSVPPRVSSFLTPTPNAFRRRTVSDASTSMSMSVTMARRNLPNLGYTYREPLPLHQQPGVTRTPVLLSRQSQYQHHGYKTEHTNMSTGLTSHGHGRDLEYDDKYKSHAATVGPRPKLSSVYCTPSRQSQNGYASYYSSPPLNANDGNRNHRLGSEGSPNPASRQARVVGAMPLHTNSPIFHRQEPFAAVNVNQTPTLTPSKIGPHIVNRKLILQSQSPAHFANNSSYSPIHRVAVLKGNTGSGSGYTNPSISNQNQRSAGAFAGSASVSAIRAAGRPEYFSPQLQHQQHQHHSSKYRHNTDGTAESYINPMHHELQRERQFPSPAFFSPQLQPHLEPRRRCFQYISSSNQNSPILNTHRSKNVHPQQPQHSLQQQLLFNRLSPILRAPAAFANHHRVYPIKNYSPMPMAMGVGSKLVQAQDAYAHVRSSSSSSGASSSTRSPAMNVRTCVRGSPAAAAAGIGIGIDKIYEEIDDAEDDEGDGADDDDDDEEEDALTTAATGNGTGAEDDDLSTNPAVATDAEEEVHKLQTSSQQYSDEGDGLGGDYYQFDYDSSLLSTTEELDETSHSHSHSQEQPSTASTSTLLKATASDQHESQGQLQPFPVSQYAVVDKHPLAAAASVDISSKCRQLLEIENDLRFCRLIAEAQTLLRELESTTTSTLAGRNGLEPFQLQHQQQWRYGSGSSTSLRGTDARQQSFTSNNGNVGGNNTYRRNRSGSFSGSRVEECPQSDPLRRKAYECWALRRLQQELAGCCASPLAFRHNLVPLSRQQQQLQRQQFLQIQGTNARRAQATAHAHTDGGGTNL